MRQGHTLLHDYYEHAGRILEHGKRLKALTLKESFYAFQFLCKAHGRYSGIIRDIRNTRLAPPESMKAAYDLMVDWVPDSHAMVSAAGDVVMFSHGISPAKEYKKSGKGARGTKGAKGGTGKGKPGGGSGQQGGGGSGQQGKRKGGEEPAADGTSFAHKFHGNCYHCGKEGHSAKYCKKRLAEQGSGANVNEDSGYVGYSNEFTDSSAPDGDKSHRRNGNKRLRVDTAMRTSNPT